VRAFLDLPDGGVPEVECYSDAVMTKYFGEYSSTAKSFLISGGSHEGFKEFAGFCAQWMLLQSNPMAVSKVRGSLIIASWENQRLDWAEITFKALVWEVTANRKIRATALAYWLGLICPPPPGLERSSSREKDAAPQVGPEEDITGRPARRQAAPEEVEAGRTPARSGDRRRRRQPRTGSVIRPKGNGWKRSFQRRRRRRKRRRRGRERRGRSMNIGR
jgi:hypothetical protein